MIQFVLCDDNKDTLEKISDYLKTILIKNNIDASIAFATTNPKKLYNYTKNNKVDVLLLDIDLNDEITGIDLAKKIRQGNKDLYIIFLTAHFEYSMLAYKVKTFDYLVKPLSCSKLEETILRLNEDIHSNNTLFVKIGNGKHVFKANDILYIEKDRSRAIVHTPSSSTPIYGSMGSIISCLPDNFIRCSKSYIVNTQKIDLIDNKAHTFNIENEIINYSNKYIDNERKMNSNE